MIRRKVPITEKNNNPPVHLEKNTTKGILIAASLIILWLGSLYYSLFCIPIINSFFTVISFISINTLLFTGLFITAHDAMHGLVAPASPKVNRFIGCLCTSLYGLLSYARLLDDHQLHHAHSGTKSDPDFYPNKGVGVWYVSFLYHYITIKQLIGMAVIYNVLTYYGNVSPAQALIFWALPAVLSSMQLFYFGTYLPHTPHNKNASINKNFVDRHNARSLPYNKFFSFLSCFNFGACHLQHHRYPSVPWWQLYYAMKKDTVNTTAVLSKEL
jgi:beta-carotene/zeaxanthin 4-ketolase